MEPRYRGGDDARWPGADESLPTDAHLGPVPVEDDSWDVDDAWNGVQSWHGEIDEAERYRGRRRARIVASRYRWWLAGAALAVLIAVAVLAVGQSPGVDSASPMFSFPPPEGGQASGSPPLASSSPPPDASPSTSPSPTTGAELGSQPAAFAPVTIEAEAGSVSVLTGSATVADDDRASGGQIVTGLGNRGGGQAPGTLRISGLDLPTPGAYRIAIYYTNDGVHGRRSALIAVTGANSMTVSFTGAPKCCNVRTVVVSLASGTHAITISNPSNPAPSIDKIVISRA